MPQESKNNLLKKLSDLNGFAPFIICKLLACTTILINMNWSKNQDFQLIGMGIATLFSYAFGYLVIVSLNIGLNYEISRKKNKSKEVGIYYQRALLINYIICAFIITPILYVSRNLVSLFDIVDQKLIEIIAEFLFQLVPSIYCFSFYDTTQTFLLAQEIFLAPLVINIFAVFAHLFMIHYLGPAWSKNFTDFGCCIAIYLYIILKKKKLESWIEWTIKCIQGWSHHMKFLEIIGLTTYMQSLFFFVFSIIGYKLPKEEIVSHICFLNLYLILFLLNIGLKEGLMSKIAFNIKQEKFKISKKIGIEAIKLFLISSIIYIILLLVYIDGISAFFIVSEGSKNSFKENIWILFIALLLDSIKTGLSALLKSVNQNYSSVKVTAFFLMLGCIMGYALCYKMGQGLKGLWFGWLIGSALHIIFNWVKLNSFQKQKKKQSNI